MASKRLGPFGSRGPAGPKEAGTLRPPKRLGPVGTGALRAPGPSGPMGPGTTPKEPGTAGTWVPRVLFVAGGGGTLQSCFKRSNFFGFSFGKLSSEDGILDQKKLSTSNAGNLKIKFF